jgi:hypothetical protein
MRAFSEPTTRCLRIGKACQSGTQSIAVSKNVQSVLKTRGFARTTPAAVQAALRAQGPLAAPVADFQARLLQHLDREAANLPAEVTWLTSSDIIEPVFGHYKRFAARSPLKEVGRQVLPIPAFLIGLERPGHPRYAGICSHPGCRTIGRAASRDFHARTPSARPESRHPDASCGKLSPSSAKSNSRSAAARRRRAIPIRSTIICTASWR